VTYPLNPKSPIYGDSEKKKKNKKIGISKIQIDEISVVEGSTAISVRWATPGNSTLPFVSIFLSGNTGLADFPIVTHYPNNGTFSGAIAYVFEATNKYDVKICYSSGLRDDILCAEKSVLISGKAPWLYAFVGAGVMAVFILACVVVIIVANKLKRARKRKPLLEYPTLINSEPSAPPPEPDARSCPICFAEAPSLMALIPCGHVICNECISHFTGCPMCRTPITGTHRVFL